MFSKITFENKQLSKTNEMCFKFSEIKFSKIIFSKHTCCNKFSKRFFFQNKPSLLFFFFFFLSNRMHGRTNVQ